MRRKLDRFKDNAERTNVLEYGKPGFDTIKGGWQNHFGNGNEIVLELACGWGEYTVGMARMFPEQNFIGIDIKGDRIWKGSGVAIEEGLDNIAFLRTEIIFLDRFFNLDEVADVWITFPDPRPKDRDAKRRLTSPRFLEIYKKVFSPGVPIRLKTDDTALFEYTLEVLQARDDINDLSYTFDLYGSPYEAECFGIQTKYEKKFSAKGCIIKYLRFTFR